MKPFQPYQSSDSNATHSSVTFFLITVNAVMEFYVL